MLNIAQGPSAVPSSPIIAQFYCVSPLANPLLVSHLSVRAPSAVNREGLLVPESEFGFADVLVPASEEAGVQYGDSYELNLNGEDLSDLSDGGAWEDQHSVSSGPSPMTPDGSALGISQLDSSQRSSGYEQFLQVFQGEGDLPAELADDDMEYHVDPESYAAVPDEWYNLAGRISRTEVEELLRDGGAEGSNRAATFESAPGTTPAPRAAFDETLVPLTHSQRYLLHQQALQMVQLQVQLYLLSRHMDGQGTVADDLWTTHNRFVALSTSATTSYKPPPPQASSTLPTQVQETQNTPAMAVFSVTMPAPGTSSLLIAPPATIQAPSDALSLYNPSSTIHVGDMESASSEAPSESAGHSEHNNGLVQFGSGNKRNARAGESSRSLRPFLASVLALPTVVLLNQEALARLHASPGKLSNSELNRYLDLYNGLFRPSLLPKIDPRATMTAMTSTSVNSAHGMMSTGNSLRNRWSSVEDDLLAIGFNLFHKNWALIRQRLLPCKHATAIGTRFKNKTSKKSKDNPIKAIHAFNTRPLSNHERDLLQLGVAQCGHNFEQVAQQFLPARKPQFLAKVWRQMTAAKPKKLTSHRLAAPVQTHHRQPSPSGSGSTTPVRTPTHEPSSPIHQPYAQPQYSQTAPNAHSNTKPSVKTDHNSDDDDNSDSEAVMRSRNRRAAAKAAAQAHPYDDESPIATAQQAVPFESHAGSLADRNRALQHYDQVTRTRPGSGSDSDEHSPWDSEESSDLNIIESARASSASDSGSDDNDQRLMKYSRPSKRYQYHEITESDAPRLSMVAEARARQEVRDPLLEERTLRYPDDYHLRKFDASSYLSMLLDWEVVWQEEAVEAAMTAAETAKNERLSGKVKPIGSSKAKSRSKGSRHSKSKAEANAIPTVISAANAEWDHELWVTPPASPVPSSALETTMEADSNEEERQVSDSSALAAHSASMTVSYQDGAGYLPMQSSTFSADASSTMQVGDASMESSFSVRVPGGPYDTATYSASTAGQFRVPMVASTPSHPALQQQPHGHQSAPQQGHYPSAPVPADGGLSAARSGFGDPGIGMMQRSLEKEVRNSQMHRAGNAKPSAVYRSAPAHSSGSALPSGLFSVLTPEGQLITTPMNQTLSGLEEPKY